MRLSLSQRASYVLLLATPGIGFGTLAKLSTQLHQAHLSWSDFLVSKESVWQTCGLHQDQVEQLKLFLKKYSAQAYQEKLQQQSVSVLFADDAMYPPLLKETSDRPECLFVWGQPEEASSQAVVAVVGTRHMTEYGKFVTQKISQELSDLEVTVVSGLMYGVDLTAHQAVIQADGRTLAFLGYGFEYLKQVSYLSSAWIKEFFLKKGILMSEYAPETLPSKGTFVQRNRLIAGTSHATVVTEAGLKSGSLHTASCAVEYNRLVCAVPGSIRSPFQEGTRDLLNRGALLVSSGYDVLAELSGSLGKYPSPRPSSSQLKPVPGTLSEKGRQIYQLLAQDSLSTQQLAQSLKISIQVINLELTQLEIFGYIHQRGGWWNLTEKIGVKKGFAN